MLCTLSNPCIILVNGISMNLAGKGNKRVPWDPNLFQETLNFSDKKLHWQIYSLVQVNMLSRTKIKK